MYSPLRAQALALLALAYVGLLTANAETGATAAVDFSGRWVFVSAAPVRPGYEQFWLGTEATITQTPSSLSIRRLTPLPQRDARFTLDGDESRKSRRERPAAHQKFTGNMERQHAAHQHRHGASGRPDLPLQHPAWSLDADGMLVIGDTEICGRGECPSVLTTVKFKKADERH
jgi:hypothetical protein